MPFIDCVFAASVATSMCCVLLQALVKALFRSDCNQNVVQPTAFAGVVVAALSFSASAAFGCMSRPKGARAVAAAICSTWQPLYFILISVIRIILRAILISSTVGKRNDNICPLDAVYVNQIDAAALLWDCSLLLTAASMITVDLRAVATPARRRLAYGFVAACVLVDAIGSCVWGNAMASKVSVSVASVHILLDSQITSSMASQVFIALHFLFSSCRSLNGRGWAYAPLRFELGNCVVDLPHGQTLTERRVSATATTPMLGPEGGADASLYAADVSALSRLRHRLLQFQKRHSSQCRVFVVPCVTHSVEGGLCREMSMARPVFGLGCLRPLQWLADTYPKLYVGFMLCCVMLPALLCVNLDGTYISAFVLLFTFFTMLLAYLSSERHGLDRVAAMHVAMSFRFLTCVLLLAVWIALTIHTLVHSPSDLSVFFLCAQVLAALVFLQCALLDCSPQLHASAQLGLTVTTLAFNVF
jgi:hypothetical protein